MKLSISILVLSVFVFCVNSNDNNKTVLKLDLNLKSEGDAFVSNEIQEFEFISKTNGNLDFYINKLAGFLTKTQENNKVLSREMTLLIDSLDSFKENYSRESFGVQTQLESIQNQLQMYLKTAAHSSFSIYYANLWINNRLIHMNPVLKHQFFSIRDKLIKIRHDIDVSAPILVKQIKNLNIIVSQGTPNVNDVVNIVHYLISTIDCESFVTETQLILNRISGLIKMKGKVNEEQVNQQTLVQQQPILQQAIHSGKILPEPNLLEPILPESINSESILTQPIQQQPSEFNRNLMDIKSEGNAFIFSGLEEFKSCGFKGESIDSYLEPLLTYFEKARTTDMSKKLDQIISLMSSDYNMIYNIMKAVKEYNSFAEEMSCRLIFSSQWIKTRFDSVKNDQSREELNELYKDLLSTKMFYDKTNYIMSCLGNKFNELGPQVNLQYIASHVIDLVHKLKNILDNENTDKTDMIAMKLLMKQFNPEALDLASFDFEVPNFDSSQTENIIENPNTILTPKTLVPIEIPIEKHASKPPLHPKRILSNIPGSSSPIDLLTQVRQDNLNFKHKETERNKKIKANPNPNPGLVAAQLSGMQDNSKNELIDMNELIKGLTPDAFDLDFSNLVGSAIQKPLEKQISFQNPIQKEKQVMQTHIIPQRVPYKIPGIIGSSDKLLPQNSQDNINLANKQVVNNNERNQVKQVPGLVVSHLPGKIEKIFFEKNDYVKEGQKLVILRSGVIKVTIEAEYFGQIQDILVEEGEEVEQEQPLMVIKRSPKIVTYVKQ